MLRNMENMMIIKTKLVRCGLEETSEEISYNSKNYFKQVEFLQLPEAEYVKLI